MWEFKRFTGHYELVWKKHQKSLHFAWRKIPRINWLRKSAERDVVPLTNQKIRETWLYVSLIRLTDLTKPNVRYHGCSVDVINYNIINYDEFGAGIFRSFRLMKRSIFACHYKEPKSPLLCYHRATRNFVHIVGWWDLQMPCHCQSMIASERSWQMFHMWSFLLLFFCLMSIQHKWNKKNSQMSFSHFLVRTTFNALT